MIPALLLHLKHPSIAVLAVKTGLFVISVGCQQGLANETGLQRFARTEPHMGTRFEIVGYANSPSACEAAFDEAFREIEKLDSTLSNYKTDSELNLFCKGSPHEKPIKISKPMCDVLAKSQEISIQTNGSFDITIGPLTKLWRRARRQKSMPTPKKIAEAMEAVGYRHLKLSAESRTAQLTRPGMRIDLGGIAKGYAIDRAIAVMKNHGIDRSLVNGGGDVAVGKAPPGRNHWRVQLFDGTEEPPKILRLVDQAVATSGDLYQFVEVDGKRYSHLVNPRTGIGLTSFMSSSVIAADAMTADGWASALALVGAADGIKLIEQLPNCEATIRTKEGERITARSTRGYPHSSQMVEPASIEAAP